MNLSVGFALPFAVGALAVPPARPFRITVRLATPSEEAFRRVEAHLEVWVHAALLGMGAGPSVAPALHAAPLDPEPLIQVHDGAPTADCVSAAALSGPVEPAYLVVLLHKLMALAHHFDGVREVLVELPTMVASPTPLTMTPGRVSDLPGRVAVPFAVDVDLDSGAEGAELEIDLTRTLTREETSLLRTMLEVWAAQAMQGGFVPAGSSLDEVGFIVTEEVELFDDGVAWSIDDLSADPRVVDALVHGLAAFHARTGAVAELRLM